MRIVEEDFVMEPCGFGLFDITFKRKVKNKETGELQERNFKAYGCSLYSCIKRIIRNRLNTKFEGESVYFLEALKEIIKLDKEIIELCKEPLPEKFDTGE
jgi:hypothetical protein